MSAFQEKLRPLLAQFGRFLVVGGISFSVDFGLFTVLYGLGVPHLIASATSFSASVVLNYILSRRYVFEAQENVSVLKEFTLYVLLNVVALGLNTLILYVCADLVGMSPFLGKILATAIVLIYNFISRKALLERLGASDGATAVHHSDEQAGSRVR
ncbi:GtrA family protein [Actinomyces oris]